MKSYVKEVFVAYNGEEFATKVACRNYEKNKFYSLFNEKNIILLDAEKHLIFNPYDNYKNACYIYVPSNEAADLLETFCDVIDCTKPFYSGRNRYNCNFYESFRIGWWGFDGETGEWSNYSYDLMMAQKAIQELNELLG